MLWASRSRTGDLPGVTLRHGGRVTILNQDVDLHKVVQLAGPRIVTGKTMAMNAIVKLRFGTAGRYRFKTVTSEMRGMPEMKTVGPDYRLILVVHAK